MYLCTLAVKKFVQVNLGKLTPPHEHGHVLGHYHIGDESHVKAAVDSALAARKQWGAMPWEHRAAIFLKAAELISTKYRYKINAATMLAQGKNCFQAEIDAVCEFADFLRFNVEYMTQIYSDQPESCSRHLESFRIPPS
jgi:1-pyrroline-5-carboxylate dehydrogenase